MNSVSLAQLTSQAQVLRRQPQPAGTTKAELEKLRSVAHNSGVGAQFDKAVQGMFPDVYGRGAMPAVTVTSMAGFAHDVGHGGNKGSALQFHALQDPKAALAAIGKNPALKTTTPAPLALDAQFPVTNAADKQASRDALVGDLTDARTRAPDGKLVSILDKLEQHPGLSAAQKERILDVLSDVKAGYGNVGAAYGDKLGGVAYQEVNWKHTRLELTRVLDVALAKGLSPRDTEVAVLASALSDSVKTPSNFIVHNVHGAQAALLILAREKGLSPDVIDDVVKSVLEHQIGPPKFMAFVGVAMAVKNANHNIASDVLAGITGKIADPLNPKNLTADKTQILFTPQEKEALAKAGILAWTVPREGSRHYAASRAVIDADSLVNYACPDGWAKLAAITGPDQPLPLQATTLLAGLTATAPGAVSATVSFLDARRIISPEVLERYDAGRARTELALTRVVGELERWANAQPAHDVPRTHDGKIPYLDGALNYSKPADVAFARRLRDEAVRLLRAEELTA